MTTPHLYANGRELRLGKRIGKGGEGEVYLLDGQPEYAVKLYTLSNLGDREKKIEAMISARLWERANLVTFPHAAIRRKNGAFSGLVMRAISGHQALHELYAPGARKKAFPGADYRFLVRTALNVSTAIAQVHDAGCVIGDINHSGFLISEKAIAAVIDADSFQFQSGSKLFPCHVGVPEYTPPELQGVTLSKTPRTQNHDAFGLAVVIFQLLFMGKHPFAGVYTGGDMPIEKAIREHRFAYALQRNVGMTPPPAASDLTDIPKPLAAAFEAAFGPQKTARPSAKQWIALLQELERSLRKCSTIPVHFYSSAASSCPWCSMETITGAVLFLPPVGSTTTRPSQSSSNAPLNTSLLWGRLRSIQIPDIANGGPPFISIAQYSPSSRAEIARAAIAKSQAMGKTKQIALGLAIAAASIIATVIFPNAWLFTLGAGGFFAWKTYNAEPSAGADQTKALSASLATAIERWETELRRWRGSIGSTNAHALGQSLQQYLVAYDDLPNEKNRAVTEYTNNRYSNQLDAYLDQFRISSAKISGIGPSKTAQLASFGIETAADVDPSSLLLVPGFGKITSKPMLDWKASLEKRFAFNAQKSAQDVAELQKIDADFADREQRLRSKLTSGISELEALAQRLTERATSPDSGLIAAADALAREIADAKALGLSVAPIPAWPPKFGSPLPTYQLTTSSRPASQTQPQPSPTAPTRPPVTSTTATSTNNPTCFQCGSRMVRRVAKRGSRSGKPFWGCTNFPRCRGTRPI
jgi:DNA-binding helix-hairpin-helix protein with protein kinase domain